MSKFYYLFIFFSVILISCHNKEENEAKNTAPYLSVSPKEKGRLDYYEQMHKHSPKIKNWRLIDEENKLKQRKTSKNIGQWYELGSTNLSGRVHTLDFDSISSKLYIASAAGHIWSRQIDSTDDWTCLNNHFRIPDIIYLKTLSNDTSLTLYAGSGAWSYDGFYTSKDTGKHWIKALGLKQITNGGYVKRFLSDNNVKPKFYALSEYSNEGQNYVALYLSSDEGNSFSLIWSELGSAYYYDIFYGQNDKLYLASDSYISIVDTLGGHSLIGSIQPIRSGGVVLTAYVKNTIENLTVAIYSDGQTDFYTKGITGFWEFSSYVSDVPFMINSLSSSLVNPDYLFFGGINLYKSVNGGLSWTKVSDWTEYYFNAEEKFHADIPATKSFIINDVEQLFVSTDGGVFQSDIDLINVQNLSLKGLNISQYYSSLSGEIKNEFAYFGSQDQGLQKTDSLKHKSKNSFLQILAGDFGHLVSNSDARTTWAVYPGFAVCSDNLDVRYNFSLNQLLWMPPIAQHPGMEEKVWLGGGSKTFGAYIFELEYQGHKVVAEQKDFNFALSFSENISAIEFSPFDDEISFVITNFGRFFKSVDGGKTWEQSVNFAGPHAQYFYGSQILCSSQNDSLLFVSGSAYEDGLYSVYVSYDQAKNFVPLGNDLPTTLAGGLALSNNDSLLFAATEIGAFAFSFKEFNWYKISDSIAPDVTYWSVEFIESLNTARFSTFGRGIWDFELNADKRVFKPILYNSIPDILINYTDTVLELHLDSFFYHTSGRAMEYEIFIEDSGVCDIISVSVNEIQLSSLTKGQTAITIRASDNNNNFAVDNFVLNTQYEPDIPVFPILDIKIYPNPVVNELNMSGFDSKSVYFLKLYTLNGVLIKEMELRNNNYGSILFSNMRPGMYFLRIRNENIDKEYIYRIIKL